MFVILRKILFTLPPEQSHNIALLLLKLFGGLYSFTLPNKNKIHCAELLFNNRVGLAAGLDKNALYFDILGKLGFSFIEIGTVTPSFQLGNAKPRIFRLPEHFALINKMGFNNNGFKKVRTEIVKRRSNYNGILGISLGKQKTTALEQAFLDYRAGLIYFYDCVDYFAINISSPNTEGLRQLQVAKYLKDLLKNLNLVRIELYNQIGNNKPIFIKISPDLNKEDLKVLVNLIKEYNFDGIICSNTTTNRLGIGNKYINLQGGLSGQPLFDIMLDNLDYIVNLKLGLPIVAVGGIDSIEKAKLVRKIGAELIQIYTGFIYQGPTLIKKLIIGLNDAL